MKKSTFHLFLLLSACVLWVCYKAQADQDSSPPRLTIDPAPMVITEIVEDEVDKDPMAYIVHKNISRLPELQAKNYPVTFFLGE